MVAVDPPVVTFAGLLRQLRMSAGLSQEELAEAAAVGVRTVSDLERGVAHTARKDTARLLADALNLTGTDRASFEAAARGRAASGISPAQGGEGAGMSGAAAAPRALPHDIASFTGRQPELRQLVGVTVGTPHSGGVVGIHAIGGMAGIGKTAFAVHAAHQLAPRFPDGQIFLPLHGHTPGQRPVDPADALASLLLTAGVSPRQIPPDLEARTALWRDRLAGKQLLLLLDDAADSDQVRPLLPGTAGSLVLVTSRRHLTALEDAYAVNLDTLPADEAAELLIRLAARPGLQPSNVAVAEVTRMCGYLPLAIGMLARQLHHHPAWTAEELAFDLAAARDQLELMHAENLSVAAAFDLSYQDLTPAQQQLFRRLALHPGPDIDAYAAAALDGTDLAMARHNLDALYDQYLIAEPARGRYRFHDLIRQHARTLAALDQPSENDAAASRLLDYYAFTGAIAESLLARQPRSSPDPADFTTPPAAVPVLSDHARALAWARAERANLLACVDYATGTGQHARVLTLTAAIAALLWHDGPWADAITRHSAALHAARHVGDRLGQANALGNLGAVRWCTGDYPEATEVLQEALSIYCDLGDRLGQANALGNLGAVRWCTGDFRDATEALEAALGIYRDLGDQRGQANAVIELGVVWWKTGDFRGATEALEAALGIYRDLGDQRGQAVALTRLGAVRQLTGDYPESAEAHQTALAIFRDLGERLGQACALGYLGVVWRLTGDHRGAAQALDEALAIFRDLGDRGGQAETLNQAGTLHWVCGNLERAEACHRQALDLARVIGSVWDEAHALAGLGRCALAAGRAADAKADLTEAREIFQRIGAPESSSVAAELDALTKAETIIER